MLVASNIAFSAAKTGGTVILRMILKMLSIYRITLLLWFYSARHEANFVTQYFELFIVFRIIFQLHLVFNTIIHREMLFVNSFEYIRLAK